MPEVLSLYWWLAFVCTMLIGFTKSGIAGLGILTVPFMAFLFKGGQSTGVLLPLLLAGDVMAMLFWRKHALWRHLRDIIPVAFAGIILGWLVIRLYCPSERMFSVSIGMIVLCMLFTGKFLEYRKDNFSLSKNFAYLIGILAGFTTMVANAAGPIFVMYLLLLQLPKKEFAGTNAVAFLILNAVKLPFSWDLGFITSDTLYLNMTLLPAIPIGAWLGKFALTRISQNVFISIVRFMTLIAALELIFDIKTLL